MFRRRAAGAGEVRRIPTAPRRGRRPVSWRPILAALAGCLLVVAAPSCSDDDAEGDADAAAFRSDRPRPTDTGAHDHGDEDSALAPDTVGVEDVAELGDGVAAGDEFSAWLGINVCGRFLEVPASEGAGGLSVDGAGRLVVAPAAGDDTGHEVTVADVMELIDLRLDTSEMSFGASWAPRQVALTPGAEPVGLAGTAFATGDACGPEQGEVQLWYYTDAAVDSGEDVRIVVTDPQDVPLVGDGAAITVAFAPTSSLPTLPPAALVG